MPALGGSRRQRLRAMVAVRAARRVARPRRCVGFGVGLLDEVLHTAHSAAGVHPGLRHLSLQRHPQVHGR
eukprot:10929957-Lingulodinium_polyedra.AAC.1